MTDFKCPNCGAILHIYVKESFDTKNPVDMIDEWVSDIGLNTADIETTVKGTTIRIETTRRIPNDQWRKFNELFKAKGFKYISEPQNWRWEKQVEKAPEHASGTSTAQYQL